MLSSGFLRSKFDSCFYFNNKTDDGKGNLTSIFRKSWKRNLR